MSRSLVKAYNALRVENARLKEELYGNEYDDMLKAHTEYQQEQYGESPVYRECGTCCQLVPVDEPCNCQ